MLASYRKDILEQMIQVEKLALAKDSHVQGISITFLSRFIPSFNVLTFSLKTDSPPRETDQEMTVQSQFSITDVAQMPCLAKRLGTK